MTFAYPFLSERRPSNVDVTAELQPLTSGETAVDPQSASQERRECVAGKSEPDLHVDSSEGRETAENHRNDVPDLPEGQEPAKDDRKGLPALSEAQEPAKDDRKNLPASFDAPKTELLPRTLVHKLYTPQSSSSKRIPIRGGEKDWSDVYSQSFQRAAVENPDVKREDTVMFQIFSATQSDTYVPCFVKKPGEKMVQDYFSVHTTKRLSEAITWKKMKFLSPTIRPVTLLRQHFDPVLVLHSKADFIQLTSDKLAKVLPFDDQLSNSQWSMCVLGVRCGQHVFPQVRAVTTSNFWRPSRCWLVENEENLVSAHQSENPEEEGEWRRVFILFKDGDALPDWKLLSDKTLDMYRREGAEMCVRDGRLHVSKVSSTATWVQPNKADALESDVSHPKRQ